MTPQELVTVQTAVTMLSEMRDSTGLHVEGKIGGEFELRDADGKAVAVLAFVASEEEDASRYDVVEVPR